MEWNQKFIQFYCTSLKGIDIYEINPRAMTKGLKNNKKTTQSDFIFWVMTTTKEFSGWAFKYKSISSIT